MIPVVNGVRIGLTAIRSHIMPLASLAEIPVENDLAVERHGDMVTHNLDLFLIPGTERLVDNAFCRNDTVCGSMDLILGKPLIDRVIVIENLAFAHAVIGCIHILRSPYAHAIVDTRFLEAELETEDEIAILFLGIEIASVTVIGSDIDSAVDQRIVPQVTGPCGHVGTVEQDLISGLCLILRKDELLGRRLKTRKDHVDLIHCIPIIRAGSLCINSLGLVKGGSQGIVVELILCLGRYVLDSVCSSVCRLRIVKIPGNKTKSRTGRNTGQHIDGLFLHICGWSKRQSRIEFLHLIEVSLAGCGHEVNETG